MRVFIIGGKARHGKDSLAGFMKEEIESQGKKIAIMHLSTYIKHFLLDYFGWDGKDETKPRSLMQELGTDVIRGKLNKPLFFLDRLVEDIEVLEYYFDAVIVSDIRFPLEYEKISERYPDSLKILIKRPDLISELNEKEQHHITETALDNYNDYDIEVINNSLDELKEKAKEIVKEYYHEEID